MAGRPSWLVARPSSLIEMTDRSDRPGVIVLPPLLYLIAVVAGWVLGRLIPLHLPDFPGRWIAAGLLAAAGLGLALWGERALHSAGTNVNPSLPTTAIVTGGPYRFTRNPLYLSLTLVYLAITLLLRSGWLLTLAIPLLGLMHWGVVLREERYLAVKFGQTYLAYRARVRRWI